MQAVLSNQKDQSKQTQVESVQLNNGYLNLKETLQFLHISKAELEKLVRSKRLIAYKIGGAYLRFKRNELVILRHEMNKQKEASSLFYSREVQEFLGFNGFYVASVFVLSAVYAYLIFV